MHRLLKYEFTCENGINGFYGTRSQLSQGLLYSVSEQLQKSSASYYSSNVSDPYRLIYGCVISELVQYMEQMFLYSV